MDQYTTILKILLEKSDHKMFNWFLNNKKYENMIDPSFLMHALTTYWSDEEKEEPLDELIIYYIEHVDAQVYLYISDGVEKRSILDLVLAQSGDKTPALEKRIQQIKKILELRKVSDSYKRNDPIPPTPPPSPSVVSYPLVQQQIKNETLCQTKKKLKPVKTKFILPSGVNMVSPTRKIMCNNDVYCSKFGFLHGLVMQTGKSSMRTKINSTIKTYLNSNPRAFNEKNEYGYTPLLLAVENANSFSSIETVNILLEWAAGYYSENKKEREMHVNVFGCNVFHIICITNYFSYIHQDISIKKNLLNMVSDSYMSNWFAEMLNQKDILGQTPLMYCQTFSTIECMLDLFGPFVDLNIQNNIGQTALMVVFQRMSLMYENSFHGNFQNIVEKFLMNKDESKRLELDYDLCDDHGHSLLYYSARLAVNSVTEIKSFTFMVHNVSTEILNKKNTRGYTVLHLLLIEPYKTCLLIKTLAERVDLDVNIPCSNGKNVIELVLENDSRRMYKDKILLILFQHKTFNFFKNYCERDDFYDNAQNYYTVAMFEYKKQQAMLKIDPVD